MSNAFACFHLPTPNAGTARTYWALFALMAASARKYTPDAEIHLLTHEEADIPDDIPATRIFRRAAGETVKESFAHLMRAETQTWRAYMASDLVRGPTLFMDIDILVQRSPFALFDGNFDLGLTYTTDMSRHAFNAGVMLVDPTRRDIVRGIFDRLDKLVEGYRAEHQEWYGDQMALEELVDAPDVTDWRGTLDRTAGDARLRLFPAHDWNASFALDDADKPIFAPLPDAGLVHFKGERKGLMLRYATEILGIDAKEDATVAGGWRFTA